MEYNFIKKTANIITGITFINIIVCFVNYFIARYNEWLHTIFVLQIANLIFLFVLYKTPNMIKKRLLFTLSVLAVVATFFVPVMKLNARYIIVESDPVTMIRKRNIIQEEYKNIYFLTVKEGREIPVN